MAWMSTGNFGTSEQLIMPTSFSRRPHPTPVASGNNTSDIDAFVKAAFLKHMERVELKHEVVARLMGMTRQQLAMQLQPGGHLSVTRLLGLAEDTDGARLLQGFWTDLAEYVGLENADAVAAELKRFHGRLGWVIDRIQTRMAKAEIRELVERKRA
jgi:hypothetical protein